MENRGKTLRTRRTLGERVRGFVMEAISPKWRMAAIGLVIVLILMLTGCTSSADRAVAAAEAVSGHSSEMFSGYSPVIKTLLQKATLGFGAQLMLLVGVLIITLPMFQRRVFSEFDESEAYNRQLMRLLPRKIGKIERLVAAQQGVEVKEEAVDLEVLVKLGPVFASFAKARALKWAGFWMASSLAFAFG